MPTTATGAASRPPSSSTTLEALREEGKLDLIGVSNVTRAGLEHALEHVELGERPERLQHPRPQHDDLVDLCAERGIAFVPFFPLGSAFRGGPRRSPTTRRSPRVAAKHGATPSRSALAWLLARSDRMLLIPGTTSVAHLEENLAAGDLELDADDRAALSCGLDPEP